MFESMTSFELMFCAVAIVAGMAYRGYSELKSKTVAEEVYHEKHQDRKINEHDMMLKMDNTRNKQFKIGKRRVERKNT